MTRVTERSWPRGGTVSSRCSSPIGQRAIVDLGGWKPSRLPPLRPIVVEMRGLLMRARGQDSLVGDFNQTCAQSVLTRRGGRGRFNQTSCSSPFCKVNTLTLYFTYIVSLSPNANANVPPLEISPAEMCNYVVVFPLLGTRVNHFHFLVFTKVQNQADYQPLILLLQSPPPKQIITICLLRAAPIHHSQECVRYTAEGIRMLFAHWKQRDG